MGREDYIGNSLEDFQQDDRELDSTLERMEKLDRIEDYLPIREEEGGRMIEFSIMDYEGTIVVTKTKTHYLYDRGEKGNKEDILEKFKKWLDKNA